jgi:4-amino-4-deoxy-L-arabinose transferase-like glycosyltransferase
VEKFFKNNWIYIFGAIIVLALFCLRFVHLTILPVFADEAIYIRWAQVMKAEETLRFLPLSDGKEPLFMWAAMAFLKFIHDPLMAARMLSVFCGLGTMIGVSLLSWLLFRSKKVALIAALIYAISPFSFFFDRMALVDSMLAMFGIWTFILSYLAITKERLDFTMLAGFALGGAWLTKSPALFFALMLPTLWLFANWGKGKNISVFLKSLFLTLVTVVIGYGMFNILRLGPNFELIASRNLDYVWPISHFLSSPFDPLKPWLLQSWQWLVMMGPWSLLVLGLIGILINWKKTWKQKLILFIWFMGPIIIESEFAKVLTARYILFTIPFLIIIASGAFLEVQKIWKLILAVILAFFIVQSLIFDYQLLVNPSKANLPRSERSGYLEEWTAGQGIAQVARYLENYKLQNPNLKIIVGTEGYFGTLPDGLEAYLNNDKAITIVGVGLNFSAVPDPLINAQKAGDSTFLVINDDRFKGDYVKEGLKLIAEYPKAVRPDGTHESLMFFELSPKSIQK